MRTFIAIDLDAKLKENLESLIAALRPLAKNVRWVNTSGMHLTLKFLGEIPETDESRIAGILTSVAKRHSPFRLALQGAGTFPPGGKNPRVLWVGVAENPALQALQEEVEKEMEKIGFEREKRAYRPHLTVGRVKFPSPLDRLLVELENRRDQSFGEMRVRKITFFRSILHPAGAEYKPLEEAILG
ncbi:MAG: RNA 2',3'-cyclic phosphodiesterase [Acidobacteriota bacterium]